MRKSMLVIAAVGALAFSGAAWATPIDLSFSITGTGSYSVDTGDISTATTTKQIPTTEDVQSIGPGDAAAAATAGIAVGDPVSFSTFSFSTANGPDVFTLSAGDLTFTFTDVSNVSLIATTSTKQGSLSEQFNGTVTGDTSTGQGFLGQTVSLSESCTQTGPGAAINCGDSALTPARPASVPEPSTLALVGAALLGLGLLRRRITL